MTRETRATWAERVERWKRSGKTADEFAAELGLNVRSLKWWKWMLGSKRAAPSPTKTRTKGTFSITLSPQPGTAARGQLTISGGTFDLGMYHTP